MSWVDVLGFAGALVVVVSLLLTSLVRRRIVIALGNALLIAYGILAPSYPMVVVAVAITVYALVRLVRDLRRHHGLRLVPMAADAPFLEDFLTSHAPDIAEFQPDFRLHPDAVAWLFSRDGLPVGVFVGHRDPEDPATMHVDLDYVIPRYRDSRMGQWLYADGQSVFRAAGVRRLVSLPGTPDHERYLHKMGFEQGESDYRRTL